MSPRTVLLSFFIFIFTWHLSSQSICSYKYRKRITFNASQVSGGADLVDFPAYINITSDTDLETVANGGHVENASGFDIVFTSDDGVTLLSHDVTSYNAATGALVCWVKLPLLDAVNNTNIYMYYGNTAIATSQTSSATWSNGYVGVWHLDNSLNNSSPTTGLNGTNFSTTNTGTSKIGSARAFASASSQYVDVTPYNAAYDITNNITVSAWVNLTTLGNDQKIAANQDNTNGGWKFGIFSDNKLEMEIRNSSNSPFLSRSASGGTALTAGSFFYAVGQYSNPGDFINTYRNGVLDRSLTTTAVMAASGGTMKMGREPFASSAFLNGIIDELRVSNVIRTAGWIATEYNNQNSPGTFYTVSAEPKIWDGSTSTAWNTAGNWTPNGVPAAGADVIIPAVANQPILNVSPSLSSIFLLTSTNFSLSTRTLSIAYDITNCGIITPNTGYVQMNGTSASVQNQHISGSGSYALGNLIINNTFPTSPSVTLNSPVSVSNSLTLSSGFLVTTTTNLLSLGASAVSTPGSATSFVSGPMSKAGLAAFVFPVGKGSRWRRVGMSGYTASTTFRAEYFDTPYSNTSSVTTPITDVSVVEYWQVDRIVGTGNALMTLYWEDATVSGINNCADLEIARFNGSSWVKIAATTNGGSTCSGTGTGAITSDAVITSFSPFTFGSQISGTLNPLPITLQSFTANCKPSGIEVEWVTASEKNNKMFNLERSINGHSWINVTSVAGAGNSTDKRNYVFTDDETVPGLVYYRLLQEDYDGTTTTSPIIEASCQQGATTGLKVFPNPSQGQVKVEINVPGTVTGNLTIINQLGVTCYSEELSVNHQYQMQVPLNLVPGAYLVQFSSESVHLPVQKLLVR